MYIIIIIIIRDDPESIQLKHDTTATSATNIDFLCTVVFMWCLLLLLMMFVCLFCFVLPLRSISLFRNKTNTEIEITGISRKKVRNTHKYITNKALCLCRLWRKTLSFQRQTNGYSAGKGGRRMKKFKTLTGLRVNEVSSVNNDVQRIRV